MGINHRAHWRPLVCVLGLWAFGTAALGAEGEPGPDDPSAKTIELLLKLQGNTTAPVKRGELPNVRLSEKIDALPAELAASQAYSDVPAESISEARTEAEMAARHEELSAVQASARRAREVSASTLNVEPADPSARDVLPLKVVRFLRENRELVIGGALGLVVVAALAGAAGSGGRKR